MSKVGQIVEKPVTGETVVVRVGKEDFADELVVVDAYVRAGGRFEEIIANCFGLA
jgi:hypothetical protein